MSTHRRKRYVLLPALCVFGLVAGFHIQDAQAGLVFGGFDAARGGVSSLEKMSMMQGEIASLFSGYTINTTGELSDAYLSGIDVLILGSVKGSSSPISPLTSGEQAALANFVLNGGAAIIMTDNDTFGGDTSAADAANDSLLAPFGMDAAGTTSGTVTVTDIVDHPVTRNVSEIRAVYPGTYVGTFDETGDATILATYGADKAFLAVFDHGQLAPGSGRAVLVADSVFVDQWEGLDNQTLARNSLHYVATPEPSTVVLLASGLLGACVFGLRRRKHRQSA